LLLKNINQPYLIAYALAGFLLGPYVFGIIQEKQLVQSIGEAGILLFMFFLGIELKWPENIKFIWKPILAQLIKSVVSLLAAGISVYLLDLNIITAIFLALILMLNSTSVVSEYLRKNEADKTALGILVLSVLIIQDVAFAPMLSSLRFLSGQSTSIWKLIQLLGVTILIIWLILRVNKLQEIKIPMESIIKNDHDLQLFLGLTICFGLSILSGYIGLSTSLGAFTSGILLKKIYAFNWIEHALRPFKTFFMAMFFLYLGLILDFNFLKTNYKLILSLVGFLTIFQNLISAISFKLLGYSWRNSIYAGALLSNIGELSLVISLLAYQMKIIDDSILKLVISVSVLSILFTTIWTSLIRAFFVERPRVRGGIRRKKSPNLH
jgi:CPA2 family monovalent cation:H+ antiporter-2